MNRCAVSIRKKQPFLDWLRQLPDPVDQETTIPFINREPHIYLLPNYCYDDEKQDLLEEFYDMIFERELNAWWRGEADWPGERSLSLFKEWFDVQFHSVIEDLVDDELMDGGWGE